MDDSQDGEYAEHGARAYVYKARAQSDLLPAIDAVLRGERFVSADIEGHKLPETAERRAPHRQEKPFIAMMRFSSTAVPATVKLWQPVTWWPWLPLNHTGTVFFTD